MFRFKVSSSIYFQYRLKKKMRIFWGLCSFWTRISDIFEENSNTWHFFFLPKFDNSFSPKKISITNRFNNNNNQISRWALNFFSLEKIFVICWNVLNFVQFLCNLWSKTKLKKAAQALLLCSWLVSLHRSIQKIFHHFIATITHQTNKAKTRTALPDWSFSTLQIIQPTLMHLNTIF